MTDTRWVWPGIIILSAMLIGTVNFLNLHSPVRPLLAIWFLCICPGMALVRLIGLRDRWTEVTLAIAVSLSLDVVLSLALVYAGLWSANLGLAILICVSLAGAVAQLRDPTSESTAVVDG